jgi:polar amino acid transport system permease protein
MDVTETLTTLMWWTPFLAIGFVWNVIISLVSMLIGTAVGVPLALLRASNKAAPRRTALLATAFARGAPTFVMLYYLALLVPASIAVAGIEVPLPGWLKASAALSVSVAAFVSDNGVAAIRAWRNGEHTAALLFLSGWTTTFLIIVMASSTASVLGVGEIVTRCNTMIAAVGRPDLTIWAYAYTMLWFFLFCAPLTGLVRRVRDGLAARLAARGNLVEAELILTE